VVKQKGLLGSATRAALSLNPFDFTRKEHHMSASSTSVPRAQGAFSSAQPVWAEHGVATFPVTQNKVPATKGYMRVGLLGSAKLAQKFLYAPALGFIAGRRSRITVLDVDTEEENVLSDARSTWCLKSDCADGLAEIHAYYRHSGERRRIRPWGRGLPIDIIGGGMAIAPPSEVVKGRYEIIVGTLDDLDDLLLAKGLVDEQPYRLEPKYGDNGTDLVHEGHRNETLWEHCMRTAKSCDDKGTLTDMALTFNKRCMPPLPEAEVVTTAASAWDYTERGLNLFGQHGAFFLTEDYEKFMKDQDAAWLLGFLRAHNLPASKFMCTNTLATKFGWKRERLAAARLRLIEFGDLAQVKRAGRGSPALFEFPIKRKHR
jgi:Primase C terminal 1 (PriCT-1)